VIGYLDLCATLGATEEGNKASFALPIAKQVLFLMNDAVIRNRAH
jgi:hypothetical protein